jgi:hypothetical protein
MRFFTLATMATLIAGCASNDLLKKKSSYSLNQQQILETIATETTRTCVKVTKDPITNETRSGTKFSDGRPAILKFFQSDAGWYRAAVVKDGVWDNIYYHPDLTRIACGDEHWLSLKESRGVTFSEIKPGTSENTTRQASPPASPSDTQRPPHFLKADPKSELLPAKFWQISKNGEVIFEAEFPSQGTCEKERKYRFPANVAGRDMVSQCASISHNQSLNHSGVMSKRDGSEHLKFRISTTEYCEAMDLGYAFSSRTFSVTCID